MNIKDLEHLQWIYDRMVFKYKEYEEFDYMIKFKEIIGKLKISNDFINQIEKDKNVSSFIKYLNEKNEDKKIKIIEFKRTAEIDYGNIHLPSLNISKMGEFIDVKLYQFY